MPVPKNGNLQSYYNWCGISLLDMVGNSLQGLFRLRDCFLILNVVFVRVEGILM